MNSEYAPLRGVLLYRPGPEVGRAADPHAVQYDAIIDFATMDGEFAHLIGVYRGLGIAAECIDPSPIEGTGSDYMYNMMYARDLLFMSPAGAVIAAMAGRVRVHEPAYAARALERLGVPIRHVMRAPERLEGADALWVTPRHVAVGTGNRTNDEGFRRLAALLAEDGVTCTPLPVPRDLQHLMGILQLVDRDLALVRTERADPAVCAFLASVGVRVVAVPEHEEVSRRQAMNVVTIAPRTVLMAAGCPQTRRLYEEAGITVAAEVPITQLINGAGGIGCATAILSRELR